MTDLFVNIYSHISDKRPWLTQLRYYSMLRVIVRDTANILLPLYFWITRHDTRYKIAQHVNQTPVIVSLTTFSKRINRVWIVLETILRQTHQPDKIIVWLDKEQYSDFNHIPKSLLRIQSRGVEIRFTDGRYRSHKKYIGMLAMDVNFITIDDDIIYGTHLIEKLMEQHIQHPNAIICSYAHQIGYTSTGNLMPYNDWESNVKDGTDLFFGSGGGTLFPNHLLGSQAAQIEDALQVCPTADDVWLNGMAHYYHVPIIHSAYYSIPLPVLNWNDYHLYTTNLNDGNDIQIVQLINYIERIRKE